MVDLKRFFEFLSIPSISSEPEFAPEVRRCALWVQKYLDEIGFHTELWETERHPILFAEKIVDPKLPTLLIYNHYDVQPVDPLELWTSKPFEPSLRDDIVYARGAQDNKGQCFYVLEALRAIKDRFPINIKLCIEGEEECGSNSLHQILPSKKEKLRADYVAIVDLGIPSPQTPAITLGTRGLITFDIKVIGSNGDMHSGMQGGVAFNPIHALVHLLDQARNNDGSIAIPGFYDGIQTISSEEKASIDFSFDAAGYEKNFQTKPTGGETAYTPLERLWLRPTLEVNGINGGYSGSGFKTVIPAEASAKLSCRLVPGQDPSRIADLVVDYFTKNAPPGTKVVMHAHPGRGEATRASPHSKGVKAFADAYSTVFKSPCKFILEGASIPIIPELVKASGAEPILMGLGLMTDQIHAPNEHFGVDRLKKGSEIIQKAIFNLSQ
jgi:acetylornithine deacetylase/succinyl-diaminopimelate desuccinylase-like protein